jgi:hypothetical protein
MTLAVLAEMVNSISFSGWIPYLDEDATDGYTNWISPLHDHARVSFDIGDSIWGDIPTPKPVPSPKGNKIQTRLKMEDIIPHLTSVNEICTPLTEQILSDHKRTITVAARG